MTLESSMPALRRVEEFEYQVRAVRRGRTLPRTPFLFFFLLFEMLQCNRAEILAKNNLAEKNPVSSRFVLRASDV